LTAYAEQEDFARWRAENRQDILNVINNRHLTWAGDRMVSMESGDTPRECYFLYSKGNELLCSIYKTRPLLCRKYKPGSSELCPQWKVKRQCRRLGFIPVIKMITCVVPTLII
jgi:Fe-S-cluster containining protein